MKMGDYGTKLSFTICDEDQEPLILAGATSIKLIMAMDDNAVEQECQVEDEEKGIVSYVVQDGDIPDSGTLYMEIEVQYGDASQFTSTTIKEIVESRVRQIM